MSLTNTFTIEKLEGEEDFELWYKQLVYYFKSESMWDEVNNCPINSPKTSLQIVKSVSKLILRQIIHLEKAPLMWNRLMLQYNGKSVPRQIRCIRELSQFTFTDNIDNDFDRVTSIIAKLTSACGSEEISIKELGSLIVMSMIPDKLNATRVYMEKEYDEFPDTLMLNHIKESMKKELAIQNHAINSVSKSVFATTKENQDNYLGKMCHHKRNEG